MMRKLALVAVFVVFAGLALFWFVTEPVGGIAVALPPRTPNLANGEAMFNIGGCASCHATPNKDPDKVDRTRLGGGLALPCPFGTFYVPNISPDPNDGIGQWTEAGFVGAMWNGTAWDGVSPPYHLYPAFPYPSFRHMELDDVRDLFAFLKTLPPVQGKVRPADLSFPFSIRRLNAVWKLLFLKGGPFEPDPAQSAQWNRGAYLVNGPGHCAECHSPRNALGAIIESERFAGGPTPDGKGFVPNITPLRLHWSAKEIASFLHDGMTPDGDFAGGSMADVVSNIAHASDADRDAIAAYIASLPPTQGPTPPKKED